MGVATYHLPVQANLVVSGPPDLKCCTAQVGMVKQSNKHNSMQSARLPRLVQLLVRRAAALLQRGGIMVGSGLLLNTHQQTGSVIWRALHGPRAVRLSMPCVLFVIMVGSGYVSYALSDGARARGGVYFFERCKRTLPSFK